MRVMIIRPDCFTELSMLLSTVTSQMPAPCLPSRFFVKVYNGKYPSLSVLHTCFLELQHGWAISGSPRLHTEALRSNLKLLLQLKVFLNHTIQPSRARVLVQSPDCK